MPVVFNFDGRIKSRQRQEVDRRSVRAQRFDLDLLLRLRFRVDFNTIDFAAIQAKCLSVLTIPELKRQYSHTDQVAAMNPFE
jgi:hypothetical protein